MSPVIALLWAALAGASDYRAPFSDGSYGYTYPTAYYDHSGRDWACGSIRYSGHGGSDFGVGSWTGMDAGRDVVAASEGTVVYVHDGEYDRCTSGACGGGGGFGNYVKIQHADGKYTYYGHLKTWSITVSSGQKVNCGTKLGQVGSSGNSTGPHLHFEPRYSSGSKRDPFTGSCHGGTSWWLSQGSHGAMPGKSCPVNDADGDGYDADRDCNDGNASIHPGATEVCDDGVDNDCSGGDAKSSIRYQDSDGDGYGDKEVKVCGSPSSSQVSTPGDCDDSRASVNPGHGEVCDGLDNDCNGEVDDGNPPLSDSERPEWAAQIQDMGGPQWLPPGGRSSHWLVVENVGTERWDAGALWLVPTSASQGEDSPLRDASWPAWDVAAVLESPVEPGQSGHLELRLQAPDTSGPLSAEFSLARSDGTPLRCPQGEFTLDLSVRDSAAVSASERESESKGCATTPGGGILLALLALMACKGRGGRDPESESGPIELRFVDQLRSWMPQVSGASRLAVLWTDLDGDGEPELIEASDLGVLSHTSQGDTSRLSTLTNVRQLRAVDLDGDGARELIILHDAGLHALFEGTGLKEIGLGTGREMSLGDVDGDGDTDLLLRHDGWGEALPERGLILFLGDGEGGFSAQDSGLPEAMEGMAGVTMADLDGDGALDVFIAGDTVPDRLYWGDGDGYFLLAGPDVLPTDSAPRSRTAVATDLDGDGDRDLFIPSVLQDRLLWNQGGVFVDDTAYALVQQERSGRRAAAADLDRDGVKDLVVAYSDGLGIYRGDGEGRWYDYSATFTAADDGVARSLQLVDVDEDNDLDILVARSDRRTPWLLENWAPNDDSDSDLDGVPDDVDACPEDADPLQDNRDAEPHGCIGASDCSDLRGCTLLDGDLLSCADERTWADARARCQAWGGDLASPDAARLQALTMAGAQGWLGLSDQDTEGSFVWVTGDSATTVAWAEGEPNDSGGAEDCGELRSDGLMNDRGCGDARPYVCQDAWEPEPDPGDVCDVCPDVHDPEQADSDEDGVGDACTSE